MHGAVIQTRALSKRSLSLILNVSQGSYVSCYYFLGGSNAGCGTATAKLEGIYSSSHTEFLHNLAAVHSYNLYLPNFFILWF